jgi:hypothetical protein
MITDQSLNLTYNGGANQTTFTSSVQYTTDLSDLGASGRGALGDGEDLYAVFHITAPPSGIVNFVQCQLRASDTISGGTLSGTIVALGSSRIYTIAELGYTPTAVTPETTGSTFGLTAHGLQVGEAVYITASTTYPTITGFSTFSSPLYVVTTGYTANAFRLATTPGGTALAITNIGSGVGFRRATAGVGKSTSPAIEVCLNPEAVSRGLRYIQGHVNLTDAETHTRVPMTCVVTLNPTDNQNHRVYPTSIVAS